MMEPRIVENSRDALRLGDHAVLAVRATGGYKFREKLPGCNQDKDRMCVVGTTLVYEAFLKVAILEDLLRYDSFVDRTYDLYQARFREVAEILNTVGEEKKHG